MSAEEARPARPGRGRRTSIASRRESSEPLYDLVWRSGLLNVLTLARRELAAYFVSPLGWTVGALIIIPVSVLGYLGPVLVQQDATMAEVFDLLANFLLLFLVPLYTMRLLAEERRSGTLEMVLTSPVRDWEVVVGKWLGGFLFFCASIAFTLVYVVLLDYLVPERATLHLLGLSLNVATLDWGSIVTGYLGLLLAGGAMVAIGLLASSITQNQIVAAVLAFALLLTLWYAGTVLSLGLQAPLGSFLSYVSGYSRFVSFANGSLSLKDVIYFLSLLIGALVVCVQVLNSRRWA